MKSSHMIKTKRKTVTVLVGLICLLVVGLIFLKLQRQNKSGAADFDQKSSSIFPHIKTYGIFSKIPPHGLSDSDTQKAIDIETAWANAHLDMAPKNLNFTDINLSWQSVKDINNQGSITRDLLNIAEQDKTSFDNNLLHFKYDTCLGVNAKNYMEDHLQSVLLDGDAPSTYVDKTVQVYGDYATTPTQTDVDTVLESGKNLYIGSSTYLNELNFNISIPSTGEGVISVQYWNGQVWHEVSGATDTSANFSLATGKITFSMPTDWKTSTIEGLPLYWLRIQLPTSKTAVTFRTHINKVGQYDRDVISAVSGKKYLISTDSNCKNQRVISGFDPQNDLNGNGYIDDSEWSARVNPAASARTIGEARVPSRYGTNRYLTNLANPNFQKYASNWLTEIFSSPNIKGVMLDNFMGYLYAPAYIKTLLASTDLGFAACPSTGLQIENCGLSLDEFSVANLGAEYISKAAGFINKVSADNPNKNIVINTGSTDSGYNMLMQTNLGTGGLMEGSLNLAYSFRQTQNYLDGLTTKIANAEKNGKYYILQAYHPVDISGNANLPYWNASNAKSDAAVISDGERAEMYSLSMYYLLATDKTYYAWRTGKSADWFSGIEFNVGQPLGTYQIASSDGSPADISCADSIQQGDYSRAVTEDKIYSREYSNSLVYFRPSIASDPRMAEFCDNTAKTIELPAGGQYHRVRYGLNPADQKQEIFLEAASRTISIRKGEGVILKKNIPSPTTTPTPTATPTPTTAPPSNSPDPTFEPTTEPTEDPSFEPTIDPVDPMDELTYDPTFDLPYSYEDPWSGAWDWDTNSYNSDTNYLNSDYTDGGIADSSPSPETNQTETNVLDSPDPNTVVNSDPVNPDQINPDQSSPIKDTSVTTPAKAIQNFKFPNISKYITNILIKIFSIF